MNSTARSVGVATVAAAFATGAVLAAPLAGAQSSLPGGSVGNNSCGTQVVTPDTLAASGWSTPDDEVPAVIAEVAEAPESVGDAALTLPTSELSTGGSSLYKDAGEAPLADLLREGDALVPLSFEYTSSGQAPALQIRLTGANLHESEDGAGHEIGFATIVWSPDAADGWETAEPGDSDQFWVTRALDDDGVAVPRNQRMTLNQIIDLNPDAVVTGYGVQKTRDNTAEDVAIDNFTLGCETTNFELEAAPAGSLENVFGSLRGIFSS